MAINNLTDGTLSLASQLPFYDTANGRDAKGSVQDLADLLGVGASDTERVTQYAAPAATGFNILVQPTTVAGASFPGADVRLIVTPLAGYANGTVTLPPVAECADQQEVTVSCTQAVTTLVVAGNGATAVSGAPTTLAAGGFFRMMFDLVAKTWYRVG